MAISALAICDPGLHRLSEAIRKAKLAAKELPGFEFELVRYLQTQCAMKNPPHPIIFRGLEVLGGMLETEPESAQPGDEGRLANVLRPFLRSGDPQIASKCALILGRQSRNMNWLNSVMTESDGRVRANLIESLWRRREPEVEALLRRAVKDLHPRVVANALYGLHLLGLDIWEEGFDKILRSDDPRFRISGIWVLKSTGLPDTAEKIKPLIRDTDDRVRRAAFQALIHIRENGQRIRESGQTESRAANAASS